MVSATNPPTKVFIDSSVLIAAAISVKGSARDLILRSMKGDFDLYISAFVLEEVERNLSRKAPAALPAFEVLRTVFPNIVDPDKSLVVRVAEVVEAKDAPIVAAAISVEAEYLATYDQKHLLKQRSLIQSTYQVNVVTPDEVLQKRP